MRENTNKAASPTKIAGDLAAAIEAAGCPYALGGAIALGFWGDPRGTIDVDITLFMPLEDTASCAALLGTAGCEFSAEQVAKSLAEHGFCQVEFGGRRIDVFLPIVPFYEEARRRRQQVPLGDRQVMVWDAETLCVFKMMFFRLKDLADVQAILRVQGERLDRDWVRWQLVGIYGGRDPRVSRWDELVGKRAEEG